MTIRQTKARNAKPIPPPPGPEAGYDAIVDYLHQYSTEELEAAGYLEEPSQREKKELEASATLALLQMSGLHLKLTRKEYEKLVELATQVDVPVETLAKKWIRAKLRAPAEHQANSKR